MNGLGLEMKIVSVSCELKAKGLGLGKGLGLELGIIYGLGLEMLFFASQENINSCWLTLCGYQNISKLSGYQLRLCLKTFDMFASQ